MKNIIKSLIALIVGHPYRCIHRDPDTGKIVKVFHAMTWEDALEWIAAASGLYAVTVVDWQGYLVASKAK